MSSFSIAATSLPKLSLQFQNHSKSSFAGVQIPQKCRILPIRRTAAASVVMMAKKDDELKEIRALTTDEINEQVIDLKGELFMLRLQKSVRNEFKSSEFSRMRKKGTNSFQLLTTVMIIQWQIARMLTVKREREIEEGINKRISRKLDRQWKRSLVVRPPPSLKKLQEEEAAKEAEAAAKSA
ncbi:50S ribosomal protein L29, chloroplastic [Linum perenne]